MLTKITVISPVCQKAAVVCWPDVKLAIKTKMIRPRLFYLIFLLRLYVFVCYCEALYDLDSII